MLFMKRTGALSSPTALGRASRSVYALVQLTLFAYRRILVTDTIHKRKGGCHLSIFPGLPTLIPYEFPNSGHGAFACVRMARLSCEVTILVDSKFKLNRVVTTGGFLAGRECMRTSAFLHSPLHSPPIRNIPEMCTAPPPRCSSSCN